LIAEAYSVLSDINRRRSYDFDQQPYTQSQKQGSWRTHPYYPGYPYFQGDIFTPAFHTFFMGRNPERNSRERLRTVLLNWKSFLVSIVGALMFFKFFLAIEGVVIDKKVEAGLFQNVSYKLIYKNNEGEEKKKRIKADLFDMLKKDDQIMKKIFSFSYKINNKETSPFTIALFLMQVTVIYAAISGGLYFLEYGRK
jgi:hypothetical protein